MTGLDSHLHHKLLHVITKDSNNKKHPAPAHALALMLQALDRAESNTTGLFEGICENFCGPLAHKLLRAAEFEISDSTMRRIR